MHTQKKLTQKNYSIIADLYINDFEKNYENFRFIDDLLRLRKIYKLEEAPVVDLGSGPGTVIDYILKKDKKIHSLTAVDFNEIFCRRMNNKYIHTSKIKVVCEDLTGYVQGQKQGSVGIYIASFSIIHIPDEEIDILFSAIYKSLVKGGFFLFSCYKGSWKGMEAEPYQKTSDARLKYDDVLLNYMNYFGEKELRDRLKNAGMEIVKMESITESGKSRKIDQDTIWVIAEKM